MLQQLIGKNVIVRSNMSGCWFGTLKSFDGQSVELDGARRLWRWWAAEGVSLSGVAAKGLRADKLSDCRIDPPIDGAVVFGACEVLPASDAATQSISEQPVVAR